MAIIFNRPVPIAGRIALFRTPAQDLLLAHAIQHANACHDQKAVAIRITSQ